MASNLASITQSTTHKSNTNLSFISSEMVSALINMSGRQRMLSQRIALNVVLAFQVDKAALNVAQDALALFKQTHTILLHGNEQYPKVQNEQLTELFSGSAQGDAKISAYIALAERVIEVCRKQAPELGVLLAELGKSAGELLDILNAITLAYENLSKQNAVLRKKRQQELMSNIKRISKEARIVTFNAQVIAARAGEAGREFAVVANVLTGIAEEIDRLAVSALDTIET